MRPRPALLVRMAVVVALAALPGCGPGEAGQQVGGETATPVARQIPLIVTVFDTEGTSASDSLTETSAWNEMLADTWTKAGLPIGPVEIEVIRHSEDGHGLGDELLTVRESLDACSRDNRWARAGAGRDVRGIRVIVGGTIATPQVNRFAVGGTCGAFESCRARIEPSDAILFDADALADAPSSLVHEIGHFFGLDHSDTDSPCGSGVVPAAAGSTEAQAAVVRRTANLMRTRLAGDLGLPVDPARAADLTPEQVARAVHVVCASREVVGASPSVCEESG